MTDVLLDDRVPEFVAAALASEDAASVVAALRHAPDVDPAPLAQALVEAADARLGRDPRLAFWLALAASRAAEKGGAPEVGARALCCAGEACAVLGRMRGALRLTDRAIGLFHRLGSRVDVGAALIRRIRPLASLARYDEALAAGAAAMRVFAGVEDARRMIQIENALGDLELRRDRWREALRHFRRARSLAPSSVQDRLVGALDMNSAVCLEALHRYGAAKRYFTRARALFEKSGLSHRVAQADANLAYFASLRGRYAEALELYQRAETALGESTDSRETAPLRLELAEIHLKMGMPAEARVLARAAASRFEREGRAKEGAQALYFAAVAELLEGRADVAARAAGEARRRFAALENAPWVAECDLLRAHAVSSEGDGRAARRLAESARRAFLDAGRAVPAASAEILVAKLDLDAGRPVAALARLDQAEARTRRIDAPWLELELLRRKGLTLLALGDRARGVDALERAVRVLEAHRVDVPADEFMVSFLASKSALYAETVAALVDAGRGPDAFDCCERSRSRALVDMLAARRDAAPAAPRRGRGVGGLRIRRLREELNALYSRLHRAGGEPDDGTPARAAATSRAIAQTEQELAALCRAAWSRDPEFASLTAVGATGLDEVRASLDDETTLLEYFVTQKRLFAFVVRRGSFAVRVADVPEEEIARRARRFRFHVAKARLGDDVVGSSADLCLRATRANLAELAALVIAPVRDALETRRVVVVPHGVLHDVPFHALPDGDAWLCDSFDVSYAPSAAVHGFCAAKRAGAQGPPTVLALPDDVAPCIAEEAAGAARALGPDTRVFVGREATAERLREGAATSRILHVATHGMFRPDRPTLSCVRLADGWLNLYDVYDLDVKSDLVVLSACETGVVEAGRGDEALGLLRGFLYAGAPRVLASRWHVNDASTAQFMACFYSELRRGRSYEQSHRAATCAVRGARPHPCHWAAFTFVGDARGSPAQAVATTSWEEDR